MGFKITIGLSLVYSFSFVPVERDFKSFLDESFLNAVDLAHADLQNGSHILIFHATIQKFPLVAIEKYQGIHYLLRFVASLTSDGLQLHSFVLFECHLIILHLGFLLAEVCQE